MDREEDIYGRLLDLIASSESGRGARRGRDSVTMSTDAWDDMQSRPDAADFPASAALSTEHRSAIAVPWERPAAGRAEIAQELWQIFRSPRFRRQEEQGTGPPAQRQQLPSLSTFSPSLHGPENQALGPRFVPQRNNTNRQLATVTQKSFEYRLTVQ